MRVQACNKALAYYGKINYIVMLSTDNVTKFRARQLGLNIVFYTKKMTKDNVTQHTINNFKSCLSLSSNFIEEVKNGIIFSAYS